MDADFVRLTLPASMGSVQSFCEFVRKGAEAAEFVPEDLERLHLVLEEILVNIARYAYVGKERGDAEVGYAVEPPGRLLVEISDQGHLFDPLASDPPDFTRGLSERQVGGLGIYLVKTMTESARYERDGDRNILSLVFSAATPQP